MRRDIIKLQVAILGATGYTGIELVRLLQEHPKVKISLMTSKSYSGESIAEVYPHLKDIMEQQCQNFDINKIERKSDLVFTALPHGVSLEIVPELFKRDLTIIDLSADYRYQSAETYQK